MSASSYLVGVRVRVRVGVRVGVRVRGGVRVRVGHGEGGHQLAREDLGGDN